MDQDMFNCQNVFQEFDSEEKGWIDYYDLK